MWRIQNGTRVPGLGSYDLASAFCFSLGPQDIYGHVLLRLIWMHRVLQWAYSSSNPSLPISWTPSSRKCPPPGDGVGQVKPKRFALTPTLSCLPCFADSIFQIHPLFFHPHCCRLSRTPHFSGDSQHPPLGVSPAHPACSPVWSPFSDRGSFLSH